LLASVAIAIFLHLFSNVPRQASNFLLVALRVVVASTCAYVLQVTERQFSSLALPSEVLASFGTNEWPRDVRTALKPFHLDPELVLYACC
ncbi:hypothetical protein BV22DRAFT_974312, partial [Leucogyrophana mollusca]